MDLTRKQLLVALEELDRQLGYSGVEAELQVVGGAAMALLYDEARTTGRDSARTLIPLPL